MGRGLFISVEMWRGAWAIDNILKDIRFKIDVNNFEVSNYSKDITDVGIIVNIFPDDMMMAGWGKPRKYVSYKNSSADIRLPIPYDEFMEANDNKKYLIVVKNIVDSIAVIGERCAKSKRAKFDSDSMIDEVLRRLEIKKEDLKDINGVVQLTPQ